MFAFCVFCSSSFNLRLGTTKPDGIAWHRIASQDNNPRRLTTLGFKFRKALLDLMELVDTCEPWYIRCIKPNDQKAANTFSSK